MHPPASGRPGSTEDPKAVGNGKVTGNRNVAGNGNGSKGQLTPRQEEVLLYCVRMGYYEIPRRKTLRGLAKELGISAPSLSLILRRAEAKLVMGFASQQPETQATLVR